MHWCSPCTANDASDAVVDHFPWWIGVRIDAVRDRGGTRPLTEGEAPDETGSMMVADDLAGEVVDGFMVAQGFAAVIDAGEFDIAVEMG